MRTLKLFLILFSINIAAQSSDSLYTENNILPKTYLPLMIDPNLTMRSGAENLITVHQGLTKIEDKYIGTKWFNETNILGKTGGVAARLAKYIFLDIPVDYFSIVLGHEYYGHGARYREFDMSDIHYAYDFPPPYGGGGGEASNNRNVSISTHQVLSIWHGGLEIHPLINRDLGLRWIAKNEMTYREASQYFWSFQIAMSYIQDSEEYLGEGLKDDDPRAYVRILNANSGYNDVDKLKMSVKDLKSKAMINAANPFVFYSIYSILKTFLWDGTVSNKVSTINFGSVKYLPSLRTALTPFGVEYHMENYLRYKNITSLIDIGYGDQSFHDNWGSLGLQIKNLYETDNYSLDLKVNLWSQPKLQFGFNPTELKGGGFGGALSARAYYSLSSSSWPVFAVLELGYKSTGFIEGYDIDASPILMIGFAMRY